MRIVWSLVRIFYMVDIVFLAAFIALWKGGPPPNGDFVHQFIGVIALNVCCVVIGWAFLPWPKDEKTAPKELPAVPAAPPAPPFDYKQALDTLDGQDAIDDFLNRRWKDRLAGVTLPERPSKKKTPMMQRARFPNEEWKVVATAGDWITNSLVYVEIPATATVFTLLSDRTLEFEVRGVFLHEGSKLCIKIDDMILDGPTLYKDDGLTVSFDFVKHLRLRAGIHRAHVGVCQAIGAGKPAGVRMSPETPLMMVFGY